MNELLLGDTSCVIGGEDCLYLNIYTTSVTECKPVMFWIHGGGYQTGNGNDIKTRADYLVVKDIILVSINYRVGVLGKLCVFKRKITDIFFPIDVQKIF